MGNSLAATSLKAMFLPPPAATNCQRVSNEAAGPVSTPSHPWLRIASVQSCPSNCSCCELLSATAMLFTDDSIPWPFFPSPESYCSLSPPSSLAFPQLWKGQCECPVEGRAFNSLFFFNARPPVSLCISSCSQQKETSLTKAEESICLQM